MRIGIDAKWYVSGNPSGKVVVKNIVDQLIQQDSPHEFILFLQKKDKGKAIELEQACSNKKHITIVYCITCINFLSNIFILPFYAMKYKVDCCLYQNFTPFIFHKRIRNIVYIHDFLFFDYPQYYSFVERQVFKLMLTTARFAKTIITISKSEQARIAEYTGFPLDRIHVVYHGISDEFSIDKPIDNTLIHKYNLPEKYILFIGRINVRKNIQLLLHAMQELDNSVNLVIIGRKDHKSFEIEKQINKLNIKNRVRILGEVEFNDLTKILSHAFLFVFPSFAEGFGMPPLESMKSGVPVIVSDTTCMPEICGDAALYINPTSKEELVNQINKLYTDKDLYMHYKNKGIIHSTLFNWEITTNKIVEILSTNN